MYELVCILWILLLLQQSIHNMHIIIIIITTSSNYYYYCIFIYNTRSTMYCMHTLEYAHSTSYSIHSNSSSMHTLVEQYNMHATYQSSLRVRRRILRHGASIRALRESFVCWGIHHKVYESYHTNYALSILASTYSESVYINFVVSEGTLLKF